MQFFGPLVERAWVPSIVLIPYNGRQGFEEKLAALRESCTEKNRRDRFVLNTKNVQEIWDKLWEEADQALSLNNSDRLTTYGRVYFEKKNIKNQDFVENSGIESSPPAKCGKFSSSSQVQWNT